MVCLFSTLLTVSSQAQGFSSKRRATDDRWRLTAPDSMVHGPYGDFVLMYANRQVEKEMKLNLWRSYHAQRKLSNSLTFENDILRSALEGLNRELSELTTMITDERWNRAQCESKKSALKGWATIGKVGTVVIVGSGVVVGIIALNREFN